MRGQQDLPDTEPCSRRFDDALQNANLAFQPPWYPTEMLYALRRATQARQMASAPTTPGGAELSAGYHPLGPSGMPEHAHHARAERAGRDWVGLRTT